MHTYTAVRRSGGSVIREPRRKANASRGRWVSEPPDLGPRTPDLLTLTLSFRLATPRNDVTECSNDIPQVRPHRRGGERPRRGDVGDGRVGRLRGRGVALGAAAVGGPRLQLLRYGLGIRRRTQRAPAWPTPGGESGQDPVRRDEDPSEEPPV